MGVFCIATRLRQGGAMDGVNDVARRSAKWQAAMPFGSAAAIMSSEASSQRFYRSPGLAHRCDLTTKGQPAPPGLGRGTRSELSNCRQKK
jgi:hypothetical protein